MSAYLFVHFIGEQKDGEQIYFSVSKDGLHFTDLNNSNLILRSDIGMKGVRDPFIVKNSDTGIYYLIATDLRMESGISWSDAVLIGSRDIIVWKSSDLIHWDGPSAHTVGINEAGCVWAPEAVYDSINKTFLVFFASNVKYPDEQDRKQRIYCVKTNDFSNFSKAEIYMERDHHVIDSTVIFADGYYYRISKNETTKKLEMEKSSSLYEGFEKVSSETLDDFYGLEGPEMYLLPDKKTWCLIADQFAAGKGYIPMTTSNLSSGVFEILDSSDYDLGKNKKRHGGVIEISDDEYNSLVSFYGNK
ncbi:MAG: glycoside hydrolase family 43 protein [Butyrivibrio sp.]|nr:glycoside hydrolase family 43 protein [Butyrivibrio sp.]